MFKINHAVLHVFDFVSCVNVFAQVPMDLGNKAAKRYVASQAKRTLSNLDSKRGTFAENRCILRKRIYFRLLGEFNFCLFRLGGDDLWSDILAVVLWKLCFQKQYGCDNVPANSS